MFTFCKARWARRKETREKITQLKWPKYQKLTDETKHMFHKKRPSQDFISMTLELLFFTTSHRWNGWDRSARSIFKVIYSKGSSTQAQLLTASVCLLFDDINTILGQVSGIICPPKNRKNGKYVCFLLKGFFYTSCRIFLRTENWWFCRFAIHQ